jgi:DNA-binding transcriptional ArsR family regulator
MQYPSKQFRQFIDAVLLDLLKRKLIIDSDLVVSIYLMQHGDDDVFTVSTANISKATGMSIRTAQRSLKRLEELNVIEGRRRQGKEYGYRLGQLFTRTLLEYRARQKLGSFFDAGYGEGNIFRFRFAKGAAN